MFTDLDDLLGISKTPLHLSGCFAKMQPNSEEKEIPLTKLTYLVDICNALSQVTLVQEYFNFTDKFLEVSYRFPVAPNVCLHKFSATFSKKRMEGRVKEREQAKQEYTEAVREGRKAALGAIDPDSKDLMTIDIGNIEPQQKVTIEISYIEQLQVSVNTFYRFSLPVKNSPRYFNTISLEDFRESFRDKHSINGQKFMWDFKLRLRSSRKILSFDSTSHKTVVESKNDSSTDIAITFEKGADMERDFVFIYTTEDFQLPSYLLGRTDAGSSAMVSFIPKFCDLSLDDAKVQALKTQKIETDIDAARGEYVFLLDRSGSMGGSPIEKAKAALVLFLKSLPVDSYFNVVSFGSSSQTMFPQPFRNSTESVNLAVQKVESMNSNMGGTEIEIPLRKILKSKVIPGYPKQIFLLTDGEVNNTEAVIDIVRKNIKYSRVHAIGLGDGASAALIRGCAQKGKGYHTFIYGHQNPSEKIIQLLNDSLTPVISGVRMQYDKDVVQSIVPNPDSMPYILKGEMVNFYITFRGQLEKPTTISMQFQDSSNKLPFKSEIEVLPDSPSESFVDKMGRFRSIRALQDAQGDNLDEFMYCAKVVDKKQEIIEQSVKAQVLSKYTAFVCSEQEMVDGKYQQFKDKGQLAVSINIEQAPKPQLHTNAKYYSKFSIGSSPQNNPLSSAQPSKLNFNSLFGLSSSAPAQIKTPSMPPPPPKEAVDLLGAPSPQFSQPVQPTSFKTFNDLFGISSTSYSSPPPRMSVPPMGMPASMVSYPPPPPPPGMSVPFASYPPPPPPSIRMPAPIASYPSPPPPPAPQSQQSLMQILRSKICQRGASLYSHDQENEDDCFDSNAVFDFCPAPRQEPIKPKQKNSNDLLDFCDISCEKQVKPQSEKKFYFDEKSTNNHYGIKEIVSLQLFEGYWSALDIIVSLFGAKTAESIAGEQDVTAILTYLILKWIQKHHPEGDYLLIRKKALTWLKKQTRYPQFPLLYDKMMI